MSVTNKTLQLKRQTGFATAAAAKTALETAFAAGTFAPGEPALGILTDGSVVLGIKGDATHGSVFYNAATVDAAIAQAINDLKGDAEKYLTLGALEDAIDELSGNTAGYSITEVTDNVPAEVKKRYQLSKTVGSTTTKEGEYIDIYKDSSIVSIDYIDDPADPHYQNLEYVYIDASGSTQTTYVDMSELVLEAEFASGVTITNHVAHGVVDPASEAFLTVGADGFKLSGVQDAINTAKNAATTVVAEGTDAGNNMSIVETAGADGHKIFTINLSDIASASGLTAEVTARRAQTGITGDTYVANASANYISGATSMNNADVLLDTQVKANADAIAALENAKVSVVKGAGSEDFLSVTANAEETEYTIVVSGVTAAITAAIQALDVSDSAVANKFVTSVSESDGIITVTRDFVAASGVTATAIAAGNDTVAITGTTVADQIASLGKTAKSIENAAYSGITASNTGVEVSAVSNNGQTVGLKLNNASDSVTKDLLSIQEGGLTVSDTFDCGTWS